MVDLENVEQFSQFFRRCSYHYRALGGIEWDGDAFVRSSRVLEAVHGCRAHFGTSQLGCNPLTLG